MVSAFRGLIRAMRPKQWTKNSLIYAGVVFDGQLLNLDAFARTTVSFFLLCFVASSIYLINDIVDIDRDRRHPVKRHRPLPSGQLSVSTALAAAVIIPTLSMIAAMTYSPQFTIVLLVYFVLHVMYSFWLKNIVIIDVMTITTGFVLRVAAGVVVVQVQNFSPWLYACTALLALFLAIGKRRQELILLEQRAESVRSTYRVYNLPLLDDMLRIVTTSTFLAYLLYTIEAPTIKVADTNIALITVPFVLYALFRYLFLIHVRGEGGAPDEVLLRDTPLLTSIILWGLTFILILYLPVVV